MNDRFKFRAWDIEEQKYREVIALGQDRSFLLNIGHVRNDTQIFEQCTGLKDKNGKLIYEGDICIPAEDMADKAGEVYRAESGTYSIKGKMKSGMEYDFGIYWHYFMYEIIGNIHENADLLDQRDD